MGKGLEEESESAKERWEEAVLTQLKYIESRVNRILCLTVKHQ